MNNRCNLVPELKTELKERESRLDLYQTETLELKRRLKKKDEEIGRLQREIHKLKVCVSARLYNHRSFSSSPQRKEAYRLCFN